MKYRLKDRALQKQLDRLSRGDFSRRLDEWNGDRSQELVNFSFGEETGHDSFPRTFETAIRTADIEEVIPYDPNAWNVWPDTEPPCDVLLRIECYYEDDEPDENGQPNIRYRGCLKYSKDYGFGLMLNQSERPQRIRFRPWIGPEEDSK